MAATQLIREICEKYRINRSNVWLPSLPCLRPIRTCFSVMRLCLNENNGTCIVSVVDLNVSGSLFVTLLTVKFMLK